MRVIKVETYLNNKIEKATAHLHGMRPRDLDEIKGILKSRFESVPLLVALVRVATAA